MTTPMTTPVLLVCPYDHYDGAPCGQPARFMWEVSVYCEQHIREIIAADRAQVAKDRRERLLAMFAGSAMSGLLARPASKDLALTGAMWAVSTTSYDYARAMLAEHERAIAEEPSA